MKTGIELIAEERQEQITKHHRTADHDDLANMSGELLMAAEAIIEAEDGAFPAGWDVVAVQKMCDKPLIERLIISGALYTAEKERIERIVLELAKQIDALNAVVK